MTDQERATEVLRIVDIYRQGCGNTQPLDLPPTDCAECTADFLGRLRKIGDADVRAWVPHNCKLFLAFDPGEGGWSASLRLAHDYLGYLVTTQVAGDPEAAIAAVHAAFLEGLQSPASLDVARASYFRQVVLPPAAG